jgi:hypothetical protein
MLMISAMNAIGILSTPNINRTDYFTTDSSGVFLMVSNLLVRTTGIYVPFFIIPMTFYYNLVHFF